MITKVISGGQIGADQAGLEAAHILKIPTGGSIPRGYRTKLGAEPWLGEMFNLVENSSSLYPPRTSDNVKNSDGTIALAFDFSSRGEMLTNNLCKRHGKPYCQIDLNKYLDEGYRAFALRSAVEWIQKNNIQTLNVAGNADGYTYEYTLHFITLLLKEVNHV